MYIKREYCPIKSTLESKSVLLLGPRRTGKTRYITQELKADRIYNLLLGRDYTRLSANPGLIREELTANDKLVVIDEIQKLPALMDEIHDLIETTKVKFLLTGSSARKLRRTHTSLMAGRARLHHLWPFTSPELSAGFKKRLNFSKIFNYGTLPPIYLSETPELELEDYAGAYLKEEIQAEALTRKIENFSRFLKVAALTNAELVNFNEVARDAQVPPRTIIEYFQILEDTLMGNMLPPYGQELSRKSYSTSKFYFFDIGAANSLAGIKAIAKDTSAYGKALEHFIYLELKAYISYKQKAEKLTFWRNYDGQEVDFIVGEAVAIEVKATSMAHNSHFRGLKAIETQKKFKKRIIVSFDLRKRIVNGIEILPIEEFLVKLWSDEIF